MNIVPIFMTSCSIYDAEWEIRKNDVDGFAIEERNVSYR